MIGVGAAGAYVDYQDTSTGKIEVGIQQALANVRAIPCEELGLQVPEEDKQGHINFATFVMPSIEDEGFETRYRAKVLEQIDASGFHQQAADRYLSMMLRERSEAAL